MKGELENMTIQVNYYKKQFDTYGKANYHIGKHVLEFEDVKKALSKEFGYGEFKSIEQGLITLKALNGESVLGILTTGSGKSTAFLLPAYLRRKIGFTLVISPLKALMDQFTRKFLWVETIHGDVPEKWKVWRDIENGKVHLLQVAPETLRNPIFRKQLVRSILKSGRKIGLLCLG